MTELVAAGAYRRRRYGSKLGVPAGVFSCVGNGGSKLIRTLRAIEGPTFVTSMPVEPLPVNFTTATIIGLVVV